MEPFNFVESISVFDIFKIGVGPSSSHTMGPWRAMQRNIARAHRDSWFDQIVGVRVILFGSLAKTGHGHGTDIAVMMGLRGESVETVDTTQIGPLVAEIKKTGRLLLDGQKEIQFQPLSDIEFRFKETHPGHPNAVTVQSLLADGSVDEATYFSVGGGFVVKEGQQEAIERQQVTLPYYTEKADQTLAFCDDKGFTIADMVMQNELAWRPVDEIRGRLRQISRTMFECMWRGCHTEGILPGGLNVSRRAARLQKDLLPNAPKDFEGWLGALPEIGTGLSANLKAVSMFALAVNEENAAFGRVVTAPTNGAAGVIPAVLLYMFALLTPRPVDPWRAADEFLLVAGEVGSLFKKGATISAAVGGCQAEIGVSSAMAAAGLAHVMGATPAQSFMAAEIAMEHHLGMTCDPIGGLVQVPCIERNTMGATKAITAAEIALSSDPSQARVSLDDVIQTMWETAQDMNVKYKETSEGGLALQIPVAVPEC
ncbi:MAG: L-serine ammonia-lyase [Fimbriimonadaceae bacterium]|nr:L-serine ammonia-lyase [Fimbriimonadaceae bacterium]